MDITFSCTNCRQQLEVDASAVGSTIQCPSCGHALVVPEPDITMIHHLNPIATSAAAKEERHFTVPVRDHPSEVLVAKPTKTEEVSTQEKRLRIRAIKRVDCVEVGKDRFDEVVSNFLNHVGQENIISINTINYTHVDMATRHLLNDFGVLIVYRG
jgi:DNA-directed RNA polymerase subunit RPC12/RpoP